MENNKYIGVFKLTHKTDAIGIMTGSRKEFTLTLESDYHKTVEDAERSIGLRSDVGQFVILPVIRHPR